MSVDELKAKCQSVLNSGGEALVLVLTRGSSLSDRILPFGRSGPVCELLCSGCDRTVVRFDAAAVLRWIEKQERTQQEPNRG